VSLSGLASSLLLSLSIAGGLPSFLYDKARSKRLLLAVVAMPAAIPAGRVDVIVAELIGLGFFNEMSMLMVHEYAVGLLGSVPTATLALAHHFHMLVRM